MQEVKVKTHLIVTDIHNEFHMDWCGRILDAKPAFTNEGMPIFVLISSKSRIETSTTDMNRLEELAKKLTNPKGRSAISKDIVRIYIKEVDGKKRLMGVLTHRRIKHFAPMFDTIHKTY